MPLADVAEGLLVVVALHIHHDHIGQAQDIIGVGGDQVLLLLDAALDHGSHFRVLGLHRGNAAVQIGDFPVGPRRRPLHADDELVRPFPFYRWSRPPRRP